MAAVVRTARDLYRRHRRLMRTGHTHVDGQKPLRILVVTTGHSIHPTTTRVYVLSGQGFPIDIFGDPIIARTPWRTWLKAPVDISHHVMSFYGHRLIEGIKTRRPFTLPLFIRPRGAEVMIGRVPKVSELDLARRRFRVVVEDHEHCVNLVMHREEFIY